MKTNYFIFLFFLIVSLNCCSQEKRKLTVDLYPDVPNAVKFYKKIKVDFEKEHQDIQLIIKTNENAYYNRGGFEDDTADVYEIDCVLLQNFIKKHKIQPLTSEIGSGIDKNDFMPADDIVFLNNLRYAIPHWLCGNFLFVKKSDTVLEEVASFKSLKTAIGNNPSPEKSISVDLFGKLTLGEIYAGALFDEYHDLNQVVAHADTLHADGEAIADLTALTYLSNKAWSRNSIWHNNPSLYAYQFAKNGCRAFIGYSESLFDILTYSKDSCSSQNCLSSKAIDIKHLIIDDSQSQNSNGQIGWVDALAIDTGAKGQKLKDAIIFINFMTSKKGYCDALVPEDNDAPRYLLPAYRSYYGDKDILSVAPLYRKLFPLALNIKSVSTHDIGFTLRDFGLKLTNSLPK